MADQEEEGLDVFASVNGPSASGICCSRFFSNTSPAICEMDVKGLAGWAVSERPLCTLPPLRDLELAQLSCTWHPARRKNSKSLLRGGW